MLLRFAVENFKSFKDKQVFSMIAGKYTKHSNHVLSVNNKRLLKGSFFFGGNASGKSNLLKAVSFSKRIVLDGVRNANLTNMHFRIEKEYAYKTGVFQFDLFSNGHFYSYGFALSYQNAIIEEEWLYLCDSSDIAIFERFVEDGKHVIHTDCRFSDPSLKQRFTIYSEDLADDCLFLSEIAERKLTEHEDFAAYKDVYSWFQRLEVIFPGSRYLRKDRLFSEKNSSMSMAKLLHSFDTGIEDINVSWDKAEDVLDSYPDTVRNVLNALIKEVEKRLSDSKKEDNDSLAEVDVTFAGKYLRLKKKDNQLMAAQLLMNHGNNDDLFEMKDESDGTQRLFDLLPVYTVSRQPKVIFVDELDRSFHTMLVQRFIEGFYKLTDGAESQLIATVHDSNVMNLDLLRQDEIWFVERTIHHDSRIYSLSMYKERFDKKVSKDYMLGRYGAIPCIDQAYLDEEEA